MSAKEGKQRFLAKVYLMCQAIEEMPDGLKPSSLWPDGDRLGTSPEVTVFEPSENHCKVFMEYCKSINKESKRYPHDDLYDCLIVQLDTGVRVQVLVDKKEE